MVIDADNMWLILYALLAICKSTFIKCFCRQWVFGFWDGILYDFKLKVIYLRLNAGIPGGHHSIQLTGFLLIMYL